MCTLSSCPKRGGSATGACVCEYACARSCLHVFAHVSSPTDGHTEEHRKVVFHFLPSHTHCEDASLKNHQPETPMKAQNAAKPMQQMVALELGEFANATM